ncbi:MAG: hypothetical protein J5I91_08195 [Bacteroidetes bacterium]|nr:hypothetical protein [Bacteroidota bacterium]
MSFSLPESNKGMSAQSEPFTEKVLISYNESIPLDYELSSYVDWVIIQSGTPIASGIGDALKNYVFMVPGDYVIQINDKSPHSAEEDDCSYKLLPSKIELTVSPVRMTYEMGSITFTRPIVGGDNMNGGQVQVNVLVETFDNQPVQHPFPYFRSAGVETTIEGMLTNPLLMLHPGINVLTYDLKGSAPKHTYIMFDFLDYNGKIQCYYHPSEIQ